MVAPDDNRASPSAASNEPESPPRARIVAIGASAGGLEPIEQFFNALSDPTGFSFVVIQHLSPDFRSMMPELLERRSNLEIRVIEDQMRIEPNVIYLNPPRSTLQVLEDRFQLRSSESNLEFSLPINDFFDSLAEQRGEDAIGLILSGTGSDGTQGAINIAAAGGAVLVQDPTTAKFDSMPRSALEAVPAALFAPPQLLAHYVQKVASGERLDLPSPSVSAESMPPEQVIIRLLQRRFGLDFGYYKSTTVGRRIARRAKLRGMTDLADYAVVLSRNADEQEELYADLLIGVTSFFRGREAFEQLDRNVCAPLSERMAEGKEVRIWVPGCASGEEAYSIAILMMERMRGRENAGGLRIFATDIHPRSLLAASRAVYTEEQVAEVPKVLRERYFIEEENRFRLTKKLREVVVFSKHNLLKDPPFTRMDLVSCRNLLIYFDDEAQHKSIAMFHFALQQSGFLFLGPSETLGELSEEFAVSDSRWRIFTKRRNVRLVEATRMLPTTAAGRYRERNVETLSSISGSSVDGALLATRVSRPRRVERRRELQIYDAILGMMTETCILLSPDGMVEHVFGDAAGFLQLRAGRASTRITDLLAPPLRTPMQSALLRMDAAASEPLIYNVQAPEAQGGGTRLIQLRVEPVWIDGDDQFAALLLTIKSSSPKPDDPEAVQLVVETEGGSARRIDELETSLRLSQENLNTTTEQLENSNEELQATNEELQATNEEMMASNEELQTVNEELHAVNEELYTISREHQRKIEELIGLSDDLDNLINSMGVGVIFLDGLKNIRRVTPDVEKTFNILDRDVGRPINHLNTRFNSDDLDRAIDRVIESGAAENENVSVDGSSYEMRIIPYMRGELVDGVVITFFEKT